MSEAVLNVPPMGVLTSNEKVMVPPVAADPVLQKKPADAPPLMQPPEFVLPGVRAELHVPDVTDSIVTPLAMPLPVNWN